VESPWIDPEASFARWIRKSVHLVQVAHPDTDVQVLMSDEVTREEGIRIVYDTTRDRPRELTLRSSVRSMLHDLTMGNAWCVYLAFPAPVADPVKVDPLANDLDIGMERLKREAEEWLEEEDRR
jgi:hypothetical protein